jgi:hypothetical protein
VASRYRFLESVEFRGKLGFRVYSRLLRGVLLLHFVNTNRSNKVLIYFERSSICVCSNVAVQPVGHWLSHRQHRAGQTRSYTAVGNFDTSGGQTGATTPVRPEVIE